jgi:hypothetical protein
MSLNRAELRVEGDADPRRNYGIIADMPREATAVEQPPDAVPKKGKIFGGVGDSLGERSLPPELHLR